MYKVYMPKTQSSWSSVVGFDIRATMFESCFEFTQNIREANIILHTGFDADESKKWLLEHQFILSDKLLIDVSACYHIQEYQSEQYLLDRLFNNSEQPLSEIPENRRPKFILLHTCHNILDDMHPQIWYTDFLWNRQINFFVTQPKDIFQADRNEERNGWWPSHRRNVDKNVYKLSNLDEICTDEYLDDQIDSTSDGSSMKSYLSPNRTNYWWHAQLSDSGALIESHQREHTDIDVRYYCRSQLSEILQSYPGHLGSRSKHNVLLGEAMPPDIVTQAIEGTLRQFGWWPANNAYYNSTTVSIYIETITYGTAIKSITEKTWDPLIKGHFILPFGYHGMIKDLKDRYNFKFPEWIDYSYDNYDNDLERWFKYTESVKKLFSTKSAKDLFELKIKDKDILIYNRQQFFRRKYLNTPSNAVKKYLELNNYTV